MDGHHLSVETITSESRTCGQAESQEPLQNSTERCSSNPAKEREPGEHPCGHVMSTSSGCVRAWLPAISLRAIASRSTFRQLSSPTKYNLTLTHPNDESNAPTSRQPAQVSSVRLIRRRRRATEIAQTLLVSTHDSGTGLPFDGIDKSAAQDDRA
jgi:hypothetical protein